MAKAPTIPVLVRTEDGKEKLYQLSYDTRVLLAGGLPALEDIDILPYADNYRRKFVLPGKLANHYEIRWAKDLVLAWNTDQPDPRAGRVYMRVSPVKIQGLSEGQPIFFRIGETWERGEIEPYVDRSQVRKANDKAKKKADNKLRKYLRLPTLWDRLSAD